MNISARFSLEIDERFKKESADTKTLEYEISDKIINQAQELLGSRFTKVKGLTMIGDPSIEILNTAKALKIDIIVVGSKGMKGITKILGSVSRYILNHSECSVLIGKRQR